MPQSLSLVVIHVIFSTKDRRALIDADARPNLHAYLATVARNAGCECYRAGGVADHVHLAIRLSRTLTIADLVENLKTSSSKWLKTQTPDLATFSWQRGMAVSPSALRMWMLFAVTLTSRRNIIKRGRFKRSIGCS